MATLLLSVIVTSLSLAFSEAGMAYIVQGSASDLQRMALSNIAIFGSVSLVMILTCAVTMSVLLVRLRCLWAIFRIGDCQICSGMQVGERHSYRSGVAGSIHSCLK